MKRYIVTGEHPVLGHLPGVEFSARIDDEQEQQLIAAGALGTVEARKPKPKDDEGGDE